MSVNFIITSSWSNFTIEEYTRLSNFITKEMPNVRHGEVSSVPNVTRQIATRLAPEIQVAPVMQPNVHFVQNFTSPQCSRRRNNRVQYPCPNGCTNDKGEPIHGSIFHRERPNVKFCGPCAKKGPPGMKSFQQWKKHDSEEEMHRLRQVIGSNASQRSEEKEEDHQFNI